MYKGYREKAALFFGLFILTYCGSAFQYTLLNYFYFPIDFSCFPLSLFLLFVKKISGTYRNSDIAYLIPGALDIIISVLMPFNPEKQGITGATMAYLGLSLYAFSFQSSRDWTKPVYKIDFKPKKANQWEEVELDLNTLYEEVVGEKTGAAVTKKVLSDVARVGIITNEKREGKFQLDVAEIEFLN
ncbi:hypothetical protein CHU92_13885 [Flavobacterium cyanobacteriorum]|uniref:NADH:ubiquinone oxidoreductase intermediate-associated protein 30 domain-containing protein n=1 Tax=Flavobacterium cyanobacteriorum TaxID=2022802 RepID=A0A255YUT8_9FLAO|nr:CIA30 family protein [Flavobacterium cyanobacteriorum]OYQ33006.1 hypothetical protein CHU92_13885 [Flavobacterium cyanobacteriorum]